MQEADTSDSLLPYNRRSKPRSLSHLTPPPETVSKIPNAALNPPPPPPSPPRPPSPPGSHDPAPAPAPAPAPPVNESANTQSTSGPSSNPETSPTPAATAQLAPTASHVLPQTSTAPEPSVAPPTLSALGTSVPAPTPAAPGPSVPPLTPASPGPSVPPPTPAAPGPSVLPPTSATPGPSVPPPTPAAPGPSVPPPTPAAPGASVPPAPSAPPATPSNPSRPRKRFRKKVSGLFGDQTELKRRIEKLLLHTDPVDLYGTPDSERADDEPLLPPLPRLRAPPRPSIRLPLAEEVVEKLKNASAGGMNASMTNNETTTSAQKEDKMCDDDDSLASFDSPAFIATATRLVGSPEKLRTLKRFMGSLSLQSNERFIEELQLGPSTDAMDDKKLTSQENKAPKIVPPKLPSLDSSDLDSQLAEDSVQFASPTSVDRTAIPAMLRGKVKRSDRGYCSSDVLRARAQGASLAEIAASPITNRRGERRSNWTGIKLRKLDFGPGCERRRSRRHRRSLEERQRVATASEESSSIVDVQSRTHNDRTQEQEINSSADDSRSVKHTISMLLQADAELQRLSLMKKRKREPGASCEDRQADGASSSRIVRPRTRRSSKH